MEPTTLVTVPRDFLPSCVSGALRLHRAVPCSPDKSEKMAPFFQNKGDERLFEARNFEAASLACNSRNKSHR